MHLRYALTPPVFVPRLPPFKYKHRSSTFSLVSLPLRPIGIPIADMLHYDLRRTLRAMLPPNRFDEITHRIHHVEIDAVIDQVILSHLRIRRRAEVHPILLAYILDLIPRARQAHEAGVEFFQVGAQHGRGVPGGIAGDEEGEQGSALGFVPLVGGDEGGGEDRGGR